jgi:hypothetical protein
VRSVCAIPNCRKVAPAHEAFCAEHRGIGEETVSISARLRHTSQGDWLSRYDPKDEEWLPAQMHMAFLRMGIVAAEESPEGGYMLTPLGLSCVEQLKRCPYSPDGRHQVDTSTESGPNNCSHCEQPMN